MLSRCFFFTRDVNAIARVQNSHLKNPDDPLAWLQDVNTGDYIEEFPDTSSAIDKMTSK